MGIYIDGSILAVLIIVILCLAAYLIKAESFEAKAGIWRLVFLSIKVKSPGNRSQRDSADS